MHMSLKLPVVSCSEVVTVEIDKVLRAIIFNSTSKEWLQVHKVCCTKPLGALADPNALLPIAQCVLETHSAFACGWIRCYFGGKEERQQESSWLVDVKCNFAHTEFQKKNVNTRRLATSQEDVSLLMNTPVWLGTMIWCSMVVKHIQLRREKIQSNSGGSEYKSSTSSTPKKSRLRWESLKKTSINAVQEATNVGLFQPTPRSKLKVSHLYKVMWTNESQSEWVIDSHLDEAIHDHAKRKLPCWITSYHFYSCSSLVQRLQKDPGIIFSTNNQAWPTFTPNLQIINQRLKRFEDLLILSRLQDLDLQQLRLTEPTAELWNRKSPSWGKVHQKVSQGYNRPAERSLCFKTHG